MADARLMLHLNGTDAATSTVDATGRHPAITFNGTAQISTGSVKLGTANLLLDGDSDFLSIPNSEDWNIVANADEDWTIDFLVKHIDHVGSEDYLIQFQDPYNFWRLTHNHGNGLKFHVFSNNSTVIDSGFGGEIEDTLWHHIALCRVSDEYGLYLDGVQVAYVQDASLTTFAGSLYIGASGVPTNYFDGRIDELRIDKSNHFGAAPNVGLTDTIDVINPIVHLELDDNAANTTVLDSSGNGMDGLLEGGDNTEGKSQIGLIDREMLLNGTDDRIRVTDNAILDLTGDVSISIWATLTAKDKLQILAMKGDGDVAYNYYLAVTAANEIRFLATGGFTVVTSGANLTTGTRYHIVVVYDDSAGTATIYLDAVVQIEATSQTAGSGNANDLIVGENDETAANQFFDGAVDDFMLFADALTPAQITSINAAGLAGNVGADQEYQAYELLPEFPTLTRSPKASSWSEEMDPDGVRHSSGYRFSAAQSTFQMQFFRHVREYVSAADKELVKDFYDAYKDRVFLWLNTTDSLKYQVKFMRPPRINAMSSDTPWRIETEFVQVNSQTIS